MGSRVGWVDASCGVSGDMLLGACLDAGAPLSAVQEVLSSLRLPETIIIDVDRTTRAGLSAARAHVQVGESHHHRRLSDVLSLLAPLAERHRVAASEVFRTLAHAEARVHGVTTDDVHFHEVGALDSIADVVGVVVALDALGLDRLVSSPIALGGGRADTEHGPIPIPGPAVVELLRMAGIPGIGGPIDLELATPTGVALLSVLADAFGAMPAMIPDAVGVGAGGLDPRGHVNVTRIVTGAVTAVDAQPDDDAVVIEANVDDWGPPARGTAHDSAARVDGRRRARRVGPDQDRPARWDDRQRRPRIR